MVNAQSTAKHHCYVRVKHVLLEQSIYYKYLHDVASTLSVIQTQVKKKEEEDLSG